MAAMEKIQTIQHAMLSIASLGLPMDTTLFMNILKETSLINKVLFTVLLSVPFSTKIQAIFCRIEYTFIGI